MNDLAIQQHSQFNGSPELSALTTELAKMLGLVAPITMSADQQTLWLASAVEALNGIRSSEVAAVSMEVRRSVTRPSQIVPEIARLVAEKRKGQARIRQLDQEAQEARTALPSRRHIADRDRSTFKAEDWAELNQWLESQGATARYRPDGSRYLIEG